MQLADRAVEQELQHAVSRVGVPAHILGQAVREAQQMMQVACRSVVRRNQFGECMLHPVRQQRMRAAAQGRVALRGVVEKSLEPAQAHANIVPGRQEQAAFAGHGVVTRRSQVPGNPGAVDMLRQHDVVERLECRVEGRKHPA